jgi:hypothetical protein
MNNEDNQNDGPTWEYAVQIYMAVLSNPDASVENKDAAAEEITSLALMFDKLNGR